MIMIMIMIMVVIVIVIMMIMNNDNDNINYNYNNNHNLPQLCGYIAPEFLPFRIYCKFIFTIKAGVNLNRSEI